MKRRSRFFRLKVESIHEKYAVMLDLVVSKSVHFEKTGFLDIGIHTKLTAQGAALSSSSRHHPSVHLSWPMSRLLHYHAVCTHKTLFVEAALKLFQKVLASDSGHPCLGQLVSSIVAARPILSQNFSRKSICSRLVLPYHPGLSGINRRLKSLTNVFKAQGLQDSVPQVAWSISDLNILRIVLRDFTAKTSC